MMSASPAAASAAQFLRRLAVFATVASSLVLAACGGGGGGGNGSATIRAINLTTDLPSADLYTGDTKQFSALATDAMSSTTSLEANTYTLNVKAANDAAALFTGSYSLSKDQTYTAIIWGRQSSLKVSTIGEAENTDDIASGNTRIRMFNATLDSGTVDVYVTTADVNPVDVSPVQSGLTSGTLAGFRELTAKEYRIRVTGTGDPSDVRLDIPAVTLAAKTYYTLVITQAGSGGVLLNATLIAQQGAKTTVKNTNARVRVAASVGNFGLVSARAGTTSLVSSWRSPKVGLSAGDYVQVTAGATTLTTSINGTVQPGIATTLTAGSDYTLLVYGTAAAPLTALIADDNRVPNVASRAKIRVVNGLSGTASVAGLVSGSSNASTKDALSGQASEYTAVLASGTTKIEALSSEAFDPIFTETVSVSGTSLLAAQGVYTIFILDGQVTNGAAVPVGRLTKDR